MYNKGIKGGRHPRSLRNARRRTLAAALTLFCLLPAKAQDFPNGLSMDSVNPRQDSLFFRDMRQRMDVIRKTEKRPTVGLVLSGGGAKGAAQIGTLKMLEELDIPVDFICGTSIGGLIGGMYSIGYDADSIHKLFLEQDWPVTLTDYIKPEFKSYKSKEYGRKYLISIPFHYEDDTIRKRLDDEQKYTHHKTRIKIGARPDEMMTQAGINKLSQSLPSGYAYGLNVNCLLASLSTGYHDSLSFKDLPIPFVCVAGDMVSCKEKNWESGEIRTALRSTMSIPGLFDPVRTQGMVLMDGGIRNNFPTDIARKAGADIIIGVDLSDPDLTYSQVNNMADLLSQAVTMLGADSFKKNVGIPELYVKPWLKGYNMLSFSREAIDTMVVRGYRAAQEKKEQFMQIKKLTAGSHLARKGRTAVNIAETPVQVGSISFSGLSDKESRWLMKKIKMAAGQMVDKNAMDAAMSVLFATGAFEAVDYVLKGDREPYDLVFRCEKGPIHQMGVSVRMDTEEVVSVLLNVGLNSRKLMGSRFDFTGKIGNSQSAGVFYSLDAPGIPTLNVDLNFDNVNTIIRQASEEVQNNINMKRLSASVFLSNIRSTTSNFKAGVRDRYFIIPGTTALGSILKQVDPASAEGNFFGAFLHWHLQTQNDKFFPTKGVSLKTYADFDFIKSNAPDFNAIGAFGLNFTGVIPLGRILAFIPGANLRFLMDKNESGSYMHANYVGGCLDGRYFENQMRFPGIHGVHKAKDNVGILNFDFRVNPVRNLFFTASGSYFREADTFSEFFGNDAAPNWWGASLEAAYNSIVGPVRANLNWNSFSSRIGFYLSIGFDF